MANLLDAKRRKIALIKQKEASSCQQLIPKVRDIVTKEEQANYMLANGGGYYTTCGEFNDYISAVNAKSKQTKISIDVHSPFVNCVSTSIDTGKDLVTYHLVNFSS
jgi:hypothetical protein